MAQGFYTLEQAAQALGISTEALSQKAQNHEVRAFADKGTWRFKAADIDALAKGSSPGGAEEFDVGAPPADGGSEFDLSMEAPLSDSMVKVGQPLPDSVVNVGQPSGGSNIFPQTGPSGGSNIFGGGPPSSGSSIFSEGPSGGSNIFPDAGGGSSNVFDASSEFELTMDQPGPGAEQGGSSVLRLADDSGLMPTGELNLQNVVDAPSDAADLGAAPPQSAASGGSDVRLSLDSGSFEFDLKVDSSSRLGKDSPKRTTGGPKSAEGDEVRLDFDASTIDDSMLLVGEQRPDSDVRIEPVSMARPSSSQALPREDLMRTEEIDLDAELRKAEEASRLAKKGEPGSGKTQLPAPTHPTQLPELPGGSPFELSEEDLQLPQGSRRTGMSGTGSSSEFELSLAPEEDLASPLNLGDDEDVDLGAAPPSQVSGRAELSGINLGRPADSGISLEKGASSDKVDFELTLDEDATGPRTMHGKAVDSDSEFELTIDDSAVMKHGGGDQPDIFEESSFESTAPSSSGGSSDDSGSQAVALDDTDLESSDFDLAVDPSQEFSSSGDESVDGERRTKVKKGQSSEIGDVDSLFDEELTAEPEPEPESAAAEEDEFALPTVPSAQAEWGVVPVLLLAPCVALMMLAGLMSYELLHGMWGYHQSTPQGGILVNSLAGLFTGEESKQ